MHIFFFFLGGGGGGVFSSSNYTHTLSETEDAFMRRLSRRLGQRFLAIRHEDSG